MIHNFDSEIAEKYGIFEAVLINHIYYWIEKNRANEANFYEGTYWTYNSTKAFTILFPYASERQIKYALKHLREEGILLTGNFNKSSYDRTLWYALSKKGYSIVQKCPMEETEMSDQKSENVPPIPDIKPDINTDIKPDINTSCAEPVASTQEEATAGEEPVITLMLNTKEEYPVMIRAVSLWQELYPAVDVMQELRNMKGWLLANPGKRKTKRGIMKFINTWLAKEQDRGKRECHKPVSRMNTEEYIESIRGWND